MEPVLGVLAFMVAVLAVLQGWQMRNVRRNRKNPDSYEKLGTVIEKLDTIASKLGRMEQRLNDIWDKVKE